MNDKLFYLLAVLGTGVEIVMYVLSLFGIEPYYDVPLFGDRIYAYYFMLGYILWKYKDSPRIHTRNLWIIFIVSNVINICLTAMVSGNRRTSGTDIGIWMSFCDGECRNILSADGACRKRTDPDKQSMEKADRRVVLLFVWNLSDPYFISG